MRRYAKRLYAILAPRAYSVIIFAALFCNLAAKFFHAARYGLLHEYPSWIGTDIAVLVGVDAFLALIVYGWPKKGIIRGVLVFAALVCTWSVINAAWLIRTGTQILPMELWPLIRDPVNISWMVLVNMARMPGAAAVLLIPSAAALAFFFSVLAKGVVPNHDARRLRARIFVSLVVGFLAVGTNKAVASLGSIPIEAAGLRFNCQSRAILAFVLPEYRHVVSSDYKNATRRPPRRDEVAIRTKARRPSRNVVIVVLEGIQYDFTSLASKQGGIAPQTGGRVGGLTPHLATIASQGAFFPDARSVVTHTTKALFALLTGRTPSASQDISETVPVDPPYASLATILQDALGFRTAFFQSAKGTFESRPGLVHNLGFDKFWSREDLGDPNQFVGYLGSDEFAMLDPMSDWIRSDNRPFLLVALCSVTHDPYEVPLWFGEGLKEQGDRYMQTIAYTDRFIAALDERLTELGLAENTIFCVVGDHGEGFGEHRIMGHERMGFEEVLRIAMCMRAPLLIEPGTRVTAPVSSVDLTPTILGLLGFDVRAMNFDGADALAPLPKDRKVYFSGWMQQGPAGFIENNRKFLYEPERNTVTMYRLTTDPLELSGIGIPGSQGEAIRDEIIGWRKNTIFRRESDYDGNTELFDAWLWKENGRVSRTK